MSKRRVFQSTADGDTQVVEDEEAEAASSDGPSFFISHVLSLTALCRTHLGEVPDDDGETRVDLPAARHVVDILEMLEQKTKGNLLPEEARLLSTILYDLRMLFLHASGG